MPIKLPKKIIYIPGRSTDIWNSLPQSVVDAPSVQLFEVKIYKLWKNHPIQNNFTVPPLVWTVSPSDAYAVSKQCSRQSWHKRQECLIQARKESVKMIPINFTKQLL